MTKFTLRLATSLLPLFLIAAAPPPVTPMTPDVIASYNPVLPEADFIKRVAMVPMQRGEALHGHRDEEGDGERADPAVAHAV